ncbi:MAG TPA: citrate/2-methylcitrate synthase, partial [Thermoanaerobaculia bacterium]|nr:citrate/2-methylcitrate synthase [Thermoanaerobaculia bacterium]
MSTAKLILDGKEYEFPVVVGSEGEVGIDIAKLRDVTGAITLDEGYGNTGSCRSAITFIDGERGILRYRGYPIEELARHATFVEVAYLLIYGKLPNATELAGWQAQLAANSLIHESMKHFFEGCSHVAHPMAVLSSMVTMLSACHPHDEPENIVRLLAKAPTLAAFSYKKS